MSKDAARTNWRLKRRRELGPGIWKPVPDEMGNAHTVPIGDGTWLLWLVK